MKRFKSIKSRSICFQKKKKFKKEGKENFHRSEFPDGNQVWREAHIYNILLSLDLSTFHLPVVKKSHTMLALTIDNTASGLL